MRRLRDWIEAYKEYTNDTEPPTLYHVWTALALISGALQRKAYLEWGHETIYPNLYVVLVGPSGKCRKGTAMGIGRDIYKRLGFPLVSESITREALIRRMKASLATFQLPDGTIRAHCSLMCMSPELTVFLKNGDLQFLADLTDWYDSNDEWTYETKTAGTDQIEGVCFTLLGATAPDWLQSILPSEAIGGGFTSRIIFIVEHEKRQTVTLPKFTDWHKKRREDLVHDLEAISLLAGPFTMTDEALEAYDHWYTVQETKLKSGKPPIDDPNFAGYCDRRATHVRKLCMIVSAARSDSMVIELADFETAVALLVQAEQNMPRVFSAVGDSPYSALLDRVIQFLAAVQRCSRSDLLKRFYRDMDLRALEAVETILSQMRLIRIEAKPEEGEIYYHYLGDQGKRRGPS